MRIVVIGTGYVGLTLGACLSQSGNEVICVDNNESKISDLNNGIIPFYEPNLEEIVKNNQQLSRLSFKTDIEESLKASDICFISVDTPQAKDGSADLSNVFNVAELIGKSINGYKIIVNKSTVPVGTTEKLREIIGTKQTYDIVFNPEFLRQGSAINDFINPARIIIGSDSQKAISVIKNLYSPFVKSDRTIITMDIKSAEMTKYSANAFLATKISFINEIAQICEETGANIENVKSGLKSDPRIGDKFFSEGIGYGGNCFPKDVRALTKIADSYGIDADILKSVDKRNNLQTELFTQKIVKKFKNKLSQCKFAIWGLSYKPQTSDIRNAPSLKIIDNLLNMNSKINVYDPQAVKNVKQIFQDKINYYNDQYDVLTECDALILLTEWDEFKTPDFDKIKTKLNKPIIFDGRNQYDNDYLKSIGFEYFCIGK